MSTMPVAAPSLAPRRARRGAAARAIKGALGVVVLLGAWQLSVPLVGLGPYFYPAPSDVIVAFGDLIDKGILPAYLGDSLWRYLAGLSAGAALGIASGVLIGVNRRASLLLSPLLKFLFAIVEVAWIPIFVVWFGYGVKTIVLTLIYVVFFPVLYNTLLGVRTAPQILVNAVRGGGAAGQRGRRRRVQRAARADRNTTRGGGGGETRPGGRRGPPPHGVGGGRWGGRRCGRGRGGCGGRPRRHAHP